jgi:CRP-like cAMP-binding protein
MLAAGETLFKKGDPASCMYVVLSGELRVGDGNKIFEQREAWWA